MAKIVDELVVELVVHVQYRIVFFPFATYKRVEDLELLTVLGIPVYKRAGNVRSFCGIAFKERSHGAT